MNKAIFGFLAAGAALAGVSPALADAGHESVQQIYDAGRCIVSRDRGTAISLLQRLPVDGDATDLTNLPENARRCARGLSSADTLHLRGAIAQALFFRDFGGFGIEPRRSTPLVNLGLPTQDTQGGTRLVLLYRWADCLVRNDAAHAERLLASGVGSRNETSAIDQMRNFMAVCAPPGSQLAVQPAELRSLLAQSAYHSMYRYWTDQLAPVRDQ
ncbi:MAG TPA: hypothetical protein VGX37_11100 [Allosphingosinicella sp.]|nr:hypothetical protein [Allosphingosinicella sp.]